MTTNVFFGEARPRVPIHLDEVNCNGTESNLLDCLHNGIGVHDCDHGEDVGIMCERQQGRVLLLIMVLIWLYTICILISICGSLS